jgi:hypothetical protein
MYSASPPPSGFFRSSAICAPIKSEPISSAPTTSQQRISCNIIGCEECIIDPHIKLYLVSPCFHLFCRRHAKESFPSRSVDCPICNVRPQKMDPVSLSDGLSSARGADPMAILNSVSLAIRVNEAQRSLEAQRMRDKYKSNFTKMNDYVKNMKRKYLEISGSVTRTEDENRKLKFELNQNLNNLNKLHEKYEKSKKIFITTKNELTAIKQNLNRISKPVAPTPHRVPPQSAIFSIPSSIGFSVNNSFVSKF